MLALKRHLAGSQLPPRQRCEVRGAQLRELLQERGEGVAAALAKLRQPIV
jgi:hypothetical protein